MAPLRTADDPYRILGVLRGADLDQIKAAHRKLAKRFHPDRSTGDEPRFLAVQEAYQLLSDPKRRRDWDRRHDPGPIRAAGPPASPGHRAAERAARAETTASRRPPAARTARPQPEPGKRTTTWSAEHVPWWEDFRPGARGGGATSSPDSEPAPAAGTRRERGRAGARDAGAAAQTLDFDVFSRSSGAAWSMAARRHFRRGDADLPSRGAWRYRGSQVVTGAEARKVAAEEAARQASSESDEGLDR